MKQRESISQQRIARDLGVSQALVSLVLNGKRENISPESYERIWNYALKLGYRPKGMKLGGEIVTSKGVGFILRTGLRLHTQSNFFSHVQHGLHEGLLAQGYHSVFLGSEDDLKPRSVQQVLKQQKLCGVAVFGQVDREFMNTVRAAQSNVVAISFSYPGVCHSVMPNERQAIELLVGHLTELGHRQFGWIGGDKLLDYNRRRFNGLVDALAIKDIKLNRKFIVDVENGDRLAGWKAAEVLLDQISTRSFPTACVCGNGSMARGFLNCLMQRGWRVPDQVSVGAIDATRLCEEEHPQITGAHSDPEKIGRTAADLLLKGATENSGILSDVIMPAQLTVRETSVPPPAS
ncbi:MAG TPA: LacI family DNA-binding transcriptional regulator [Verrucomicrobiota bacterium]|nr:LacI family DNA-binding transcriptional regulator [Verrucomicrobiota bacterium]